MLEKKETVVAEIPFSRRGGLEILCVKPEPKEDRQDITDRDLAGELRERYWIEKAADAGMESNTWVSVGAGLRYKIERHELGRTRNEPGDGFRYVSWTGTSGTGERAEWFEVTEVFEGVEAKEIEAFMRIENGAEAGFEFDTERFLSGLDLCIPRRAAQRRAADKVIAAVERKLNKASYESMSEKHGYGTLIVGLPLWFATYPLDPLRMENVIDDFTTRTQIGLKRYARQLKKKECPFWRIVVVWKVSTENIREWSTKAKADVYDDPAYRRISDFPCKMVSTLLLLEELDRAAEETESEEWYGGTTLHVVVARPEKEGKFVQLPPIATVIKRSLKAFKSHPEWTLPERVKFHVMRRVLEVLCFVRVHGLMGLERWVIARLSPRRWIVGFAMRRRILRLYRASRRRGSL